jgi:hypothetical protein
MQWVRSRKNVNVPVLLVTAAALLGSLLGPQLPANASEDGQEPETSDNAADFAEVSGYTPEQAQRVLDGQEEFSLLLMDLELNSDIYAGGAIAPTDSTDAWIAFTTEPDDRTLERIGALALATDVRVGARWTARELTTALAAAHESIEGADGVAGATG